MEVAGHPKAGGPDRARARSRCALLFAAALAGLVVASPGAGAQDGESEASAEPRAQANAPRPWRAYPLNQVDRNLAAQARQDACDFESRQRAGSKALLIMHLGRASRLRNKFGIGPESNFRPNNRIYEALLAAGRAYRDCRGGARKRVELAYGFTNYELSKHIGTQGGAAQAGRAQGRVVAKLRRRLPKGVGSAIAADIEPGWDKRGSTYGIKISAAGASAPGRYYNYGTAGHCKPFGSGCQGNWTPLDVGRVAQDRGIIPLPQIYYPTQAKGWARIAKRWDKARCPGPKRRKCFAFGGVTAHPQGCADVDFSPGESWRRMRQATDHHVGRRIIYFNPRRVGCREPASAQTQGAPVIEPVAPAVELPLMPAEVPGEIVADPDVPFSADEMGEIENAWRVGSHREYTWVYAGSGPADPVTGEPSDTGRLIVTREVYSRTEPMEATIQTVDVQGAGALRIAEAPVGARVTSSGHDGAVQWVGENGATGTIDLGELSGAD